MMWSDEKRIAFQGFLATAAFKGASPDEQAGMIEAWLLTWAVVRARGA